MASHLAILKLFFLSTFRRHMMLFIAFIQPFFMVTIFHAMGSYETDIQSFWFVLVNSSLIVTWGIFVFSTLSDIDRDRWTGVLRYYSISPTPTLAVFFYRLLSNLVFALFAVALILALCFLLYRPNVVDIFSPAWGLLALDITLIALFSGVIAGIVAMTHHSRVIMNFIEYPIIVLSGLGFTIGILPTFMQKFAFIFPFGFVSELVRIETGISRTTLEPLDYWFLPVLGFVLLALVGWKIFGAMQARLTRIGGLQ